MTRISLREVGGGRVGRWGLRGLGWVFWQFWPFFGRCLFCFFSKAHTGAWLKGVWTCKCDLETNCKSQCLPMYKNIDRHREFINSLSPMHTESCITFSSRKRPSSPFFLLHLLKKINSECLNNNEWANFSRINHWSHRLSIWVLSEFWQLMLWQSLQIKHSQAQTPLRLTLGTSLALLFCFTFLFKLFSYFILCF